MCFKLLLAAASLWLPVLTRAIIMGNKYPLQLVPWIVYGEGFYNDTKNIFSGVLIHPQMVLTVAGIVKNMENIVLYVGMADVSNKEAGQYRMVVRGPYNEHVGILEVRRPFKLGQNVQLCSLTRSWKVLHSSKPYYAAGWGQVNWFNTYPQELHYTAVYPSYVGLFGNIFVKFLMTGVGGKALILGDSDVGGPVWDPVTGEVVGLIYKAMYIDYIVERTYHAAISVGNHRKWIQSTMFDLLGLEEQTTTTTEATEEPEVTEPEPEPEETN